MKPGFLISVVLSAGILAAQSTPQFIWQGDVDGTSILHIHAKRLDVENRSGLPVQRQRYRFYDPLPDSRQTVRLEVREGRGNVRITDQPRLENDYTLSVTIEDVQAGSSFYSIALFWDTNRGTFSDQRDRARQSLPNTWGDSVTWTGRVNGEAVIECRRDVCRATTTRGHSVTGDRFQFSRPLPNRPVEVGLDDSRGRGEVRLLEQPGEANGYTAKILIRDSQGGASDYSFTLSWSREGRDQPEPAYQTRGMIWYGRVDGRVRVIVQGDNAWSEVIAGMPASAERAVFSRPLPARGSLSPTIKRLHGRGRVEVVEYPSNRNGYRLVFEIEDKDGGSDNYEVEVSW